MSTYIRWEGKNRETGTRVQILDLAHPDSTFAGDGGLRWGTMCLSHNFLQRHATSQTAWDASAHPLGWCPGCLKTNSAEQRVSDILATPVVEKPKRTRKATNPLGLPQKSFDYFVDLAKDAGNWSGNPWLNGNVASGKSASAMSQTLVRAGLITIGHDGDDAFAIFTDAGRAAAASIGIEV